MQYTPVPFEVGLWESFTKEATKQGKRPARVAAQLLREYIEIQQDIALFEEMRQSARGRFKSDEEAVEFVKQYRREKRAALIKTEPRAQTRKHAASRSRVRSSQIKYQRNKRSEGSE